MSLKIRLRRQGKRNRPFYRLVVADSKSPRDGKYVEMVGWYNPFGKNDQEEVKVDIERISYWLSHGAQLTEKANTLVKKVSKKV